MAVTKFARVFDFEAFQTTAPSTPLPASNIESELDAIKAVSDNIIDALNTIQNDDLSLGNASVHVDSFNAGSLALMGGSWLPRGVWATSTIYAIGDVISETGVAHVSTVAHTSGTFATDLATGKWVAFANASVATIYDNTASRLDATNIQAAVDELALMPDGYLSKSVAGAIDVTLTAAEADNMVLKLTGAITANINVVVPTEERVWVFDNSTTGSFTVTVKTSAGTGVAITQSQTAILNGDGTNIVLVLQGIVPANPGDDTKLLQASGGVVAWGPPITTLAESLLADETASAMRTSIDALRTTGSGASLTGVDLTGVKHLFIPASAMLATVTTGCSTLQKIETTNDRPDLHALDFVTSAETHAQFEIAMPDSWDKGTVKFQYFWTVSGGVSTGVSFRLDLIAAADNESIDTAWPSSTPVDDDAQGATEELLVSPESTALVVSVVSAALADNMMIFGRITRAVGEANDDMTQDARLLGIRLIYTTNAGNDA